MTESTVQIDVDQVVEDPGKFKASLGIGKKAYRILIAKDRLSDMLNIVGAAVAGGVAAKSPVVATTFFSSGGILGLFTTAATPVGWVAAAGVVTAGACYGMMRLVEKVEDKCVYVIPRFINTPLDVLAVALCDLIMPIALKVSAADGQILCKEKNVIKGYLENDWGYDSSYVDAAMRLFEEGIDKYTIRDLTSNLRKLTESNKDCNQEKILGGLVSTLNDIAWEDKKIHEKEEQVIKEISEGLQGDSSVHRISSKIKSIEVSEKLKRPFRVVQMSVKDTSKKFFKILKNSEDEKNKHKWYTFQRFFFKK